MWINKKMCQSVSDQEILFTDLFHLELNTSHVWNGFHTWSHPKITLHVVSLSSFQYCPPGPSMPRTHHHLTYYHHHCHHHWPHHHHIIIITSTTSLAETSWWRHVGTGNGEGVRRLPGRDGSHPYNHQPTYCTFWNCFSIVGDQTIGKSTIEWNEIFPY